jgi:hypothetical protein
MSSRRRTPNLTPFVQFIRRRPRKLGKRDNLGEKGAF